MANSDLICNTPTASGDWQALPLPPGLVCPSCQSELGSDHEQIRCLRCSHTATLIQGVPSFLERDVYWQIASRSGIEEFLEQALRNGWDAAVDTLPRSQKDYWFDGRRAAFRGILPSREFDSVLDLGCGAGAITAEFSKISREVWGLDACLDSLRILQLRARSCGLSNLNVVHGTATRLPFPDGKFDCIIMNGVLERVGYDGPHAEVALRQNRAVAECSRCLRPGGVLYIGIENRFGANYLLGAPDEHTGLRFVNVLPRSVANIYSRLVRKQEFTAFTHSAWDLGHMLERVGFGKVRFWSPLPSYREIRLLTPLTEAPADLVKEVAQIYPHRVPRWVRTVSCAIPHQLWRFLSPHFAVVATKRDA